MFGMTQIAHEPGQPKRGGDERGGGRPHHLDEFARTPSRPKGTDQRLVWASRSRRYGIRHQDLHRHEVGDLTLGVEGCRWQASNLW